MVHMNIKARAIPFLKMNGLGNDFVIFDSRQSGFSPSEKFVRDISNRKTGIGCDQIMVLYPPKSAGADVFMDIFNCDGGQVGACGNATRCVASLLMEELGRDNCVVETVKGMLKTWRDFNRMIAVDFGEPHTKWSQIPMAREVDTLHAPVASGGLFAPCCVNVGNPHAVFFVPNVDEVALEKVGPVLEHDPLFPERCNIEIAQIIAPDRIRMRVWERGTGITRACGTGALATLIAAVRRDLTIRRATVVLDGGELVIKWRKEDNHVILIGPYSYVFSGEIAETFGNEATAA
ncbi:MAG: diaminopimelate epimerase [Alphaproteobacteria bacterium]|nr:diaminopimelate epimerase [Alphaproteobacteria bacterium]